MELKGFRELLLKKSADNPNISGALHSISEELFAEFVIESLEKMAGNNKGAGRAAPGPLTQWAETMSDSDVDMLRDAVSHHVSHYRSALKNNNRALADQHLEQVVPLMHLIDQMRTHSNGKLKIKYPSLRPWEMNYTTALTRQEAVDAGYRRPLEPDKNGIFPDPDALHREHDGLGQRPAKTTSRKDAFSSVPDYRYLEMLSHPHAETRPKGSAPHDALRRDSGYPFEEIQIGDPLSIGKGEGFINVRDISPQDSYVPFVTDKHPAFQLVKRGEKQSKFGGNPKKMEQYTKDLASYLHDPLHESYDGFLEEGEKDPNFGQRHTKKSTHFWDGLSLLPQEDHIRHHDPKSPVTAAAPQPAAPQPAAPQPAKFNVSDLPAELQGRFGKK